MPRVSKKTEMNPIVANRPIVHKKPRVQLAMGAKALKMDQAQKLLGWRVIKKDEKVDPELENGRVKDFLGTDVVLMNNLTNRPIDMSWVKVLAEELLFGNWTFNFENVIISERGFVVSGQHRLLALVYACQMWDEDSDRFPLWKSHPTMECSIGYGVSDDPKTVRTLDTNRPATLSDSLYRSQYFFKLAPKERKLVAKMMDNAIRFLWDRTGVKDAFGLTRTHSHAIEFLERHGYMQECVALINQENMDKGISTYIPVGRAAGMMYLMACCDADNTKYKEAAQPTERMLKFNHRAKARKFWELLGSPDASEPELNGQFDIVRKLINDMTSDEDVYGSNDKTAECILIKAWQLFVNDTVITRKLIKPKMGKETTDEYTWHYIDEEPLLGGIDFGGCRVDEDLDADEEIEDELEEEIEPEEVAETETEEEPESEEAVEVSKEELVEA